MPTTKLKNMLYRAALPWKAPKLENPEITAFGTTLSVRNGMDLEKEYLRLLRRHHVLGSAALLKDDTSSVTLLCSSENPLRIVSEDSMFRVASITKMATALAVMAAAEKGFLSLDQPFLSYFPELEGLIPELEGVTPIHLMSHTSGLKDPEGMEQALMEGRPFQQIMTGCRASRPGDVFHYSNLGFGLLGCLLEKIIDLPIAQAMNQLVFSPLSMKATLDASTLVQMDIVPIARVLPYHPGQDLFITPLGAIPQTAPDPLRHYGYTAGAMYTDIHSLEKLLDCLRREGQPLIIPESGRRMLAKRAAYGSISPTLSYGLGILRIEDPSLSDSVILGHQGFAYGCADGAFWEEGTGRMVIFLNGGASEARRGRLGDCNYELLKWALKKEMLQWSGSVK